MLTSRRPSQNLIYALDESLKQIVDGGVSLETRWKVHKDASKKFKAAAAELGFKQVRLALFRLPWRHH